MTSVFDQYDWSDVAEEVAKKGVPKGTLPPIIAIAYAPEYKRAIDHLRVLMERNEHSKRALELTGALIEENPAHYTVYAYRLDILKAMGKELIPQENWLVKSGNPKVVEDGDWINEVVLMRPKNYQVWNYRQLLEVDTAEYYVGELCLTDIVLEEDAKNYHTWTHRQWVVSRALDKYVQFDKELQMCTKLIEDDVRNNSAWNYRYFLYTQKPEILIKEEVFAKELEYVEAKIKLAPENESVWSYLAGIYRKWRPEETAELEELCLQYGGDVLKSTYALELLVDLCEKSRPDKAKQALETLKERVPVRKGYWDYREKLIAV
ncbi:protein farnesyltransferase/geranylgeranyltransferase type-1 subunit alpha [Trichomonascus vanleenenianus]|uniref:bifunctional protein farnesyltransferase/protein geranylgeranyltransferase n=1 Tax=Trichomonascus vanleenenianus TaxID=2268995 RepID=UPI003ECB7955